MRTAGGRFRGARPTGSCRSSRTGCSRSGSRRAIRSASSRATGSSGRCSTSRSPTSGRSPLRSTRRTRRRSARTSSSMRTRSVAWSTPTYARRSKGSSSSTSSSASASTSSVRWVASTPRSTQARSSGLAEQIGDDDLFTLIYTSGTTGPPKGCMILNRNYYDMVGTIDEIEAFFLPTDVMLLYLPLAHNFGRLMHLLGAHLGFTIAFLADPRRIGDVMPQVRPTILPTVPRVLEKVHTAVSANFAAATGIKRRLVDWALGVGTGGERPPPAPRADPRRPRLQAPTRRPARLLEGEGAARRTAPRRDLRRRAAREGDRRVLPRARHPDPRGLRPDRGDERRDRQPAHALQVRHRRPRDPGYRAQAGRRRRDPDRRADRVRGLSQRRGGDASRAPRRRLAPHRRRRHARRGRLPDRHRPQEGHDRDRRREERLAAEPREHAQDRPVWSRRRSSSATGGRTSSR